MQEKPETKKSNENEEEENIEVLDFNKPNYEFIPKGSHEFSQRGPYLLCKACDLEHAVYIGMEKIMVGVGDDGQPILKNRS